MLNIIIDSQGLINRDFCKCKLKHVNSCKLCTRLSVPTYVSLYKCIN